MAWIDEFKKLFSEGESSLSEIVSNMRDLGTWQTLLNYLKEEEYGTASEWSANPKATHQLIFGHEIGNNSVIDQFDNTIDLDSGDYGPGWSFDDVIANSSKIWNESLGTMIGYWKTNFQNNGETSLFGPVTISTIKKADAGNEFIENGTYVVPFRNIDQESYTKVRSEDRVPSVLNSNRNLQFTRTQSDEASFLRLIMPKYTRRVEIEDLNRNFWVIGQTISGISSYLFEVNSPLGNLFNSILSEIVQLWENVMYLWAQMAILTGEAPIKVIYLPMPNNSLQPYRKYDNFSHGTGDAKERIEFLADKYPNNSLVVVPYTRADNYDHNYFGCYYIARIFFYNKIKGQWFWRYLCKEGTHEVDDDGNYRLKIDPTSSDFNEGSQITSFTYNEKNYKAIRIIPHIEAKYSNIDIKITKFVLDVVDVGSGTKTREITYSASNMDNWIDKSTDSGKDSHGRYFVNIKLNDVEDVENYSSKICYLGDCVSREVSS